VSPRAARVAKGAGIAIVAFVAAAALINGFTPHASGPPSSSYATAADGLAGYASLLGRNGHPVIRLRTAPSHAALDPRDTLVFLDPEVVLREDVAAMRRFVIAGGRLIAGGREPETWVSELLGDSPAWSATGPARTGRLLPLAETSGVGTVDTAGEGSWSDAGATVPVVGEPGTSLLTVTRLGKGRIALLADPSPLQNRLLADADNAALGLALAGGQGRPVAFDEAAHGYGGKRGLGALPTRWKWTLIGLLVAALVAVAARIRRLGPPEPQAAPLLPPRRAHVEALASALSRTGRPGEAAAPVRRHARAQILRRAGLPATAADDAVRDAAERLGLSAEEIRAVTSGADGDLLEVGRASAKLTKSPA
jgi:Domain of unknown function (DUF4350)